MKTIKDLKDSRDWDQLDFDEKLDITINTMFVHNKINIEEKIDVGEYGNEATIELACVEDDEKEAITEGWIILAYKPDIEIHIRRGNGQPYFTDEDMIWDTIYNYLDRLLEEEK